MKEVHFIHFDSRTKRVQTRQSYSFFEKQKIMYIFLDTVFGCFMSGIFSADIHKFIVDLMVFFACVYEFE